MNTTKLIALPERAVDLAGNLAGKWGGEVMEFMPRAGKWLETGAKLGVVKTGSTVAMKFVRRHPLAAVATVAGAGALWYLARRARQRAEEGNGREPIEGSARRVEAKRAGTARKRPARKTATRSRASTASDES